MQQAKASYSILLSYRRLRICEAEDFTIVKNLHCEHSWNYCNIIIAFSMDFGGFLLIKVKSCWLYSKLYTLSWVNLAHLIRITLMLKFQIMCVWYMYIYTECQRRNGPNFGRVFLMLNYTDITQNTYIQSWTVTEIMARENCGHLAFPRNVRLQL